MAQYRKDVFNLAPGLGRALSDPREAEARAREQSNRAQQDMIQRHRIQQRELELREQAAQQRLAQAQARMSAPSMGYSSSPQGSQREQALQRLMSSMGIKPRFGSTASHDLGAGRPQEDGFSVRSIPGPSGDWQPGAVDPQQMILSRLQNQQQAAQAQAGFGTNDLLNAQSAQQFMGLEKERDAFRAMEEAKALEASRYADKKGFADTEQARKGGESWAKIMQTMNEPGMLAAKLASNERIAGVRTKQAKALAAAKAKAAEIQEAEAAVDPLRRHIMGGGEWDLATSQAMDDAYSTLRGKEARKAFRTIKKDLQEVAKRKAEHEIYGDPRDEGFLASNARLDEEIKKAFPFVSDVQDFMSKIPGLRIPETREIQLKKALKLIGIE